MIPILENMNKFLIIFIVFFLSSCSVKNKKIYSWESSVVQYGMISCHKSLEKVFNDSYKNQGNTWNTEKVVSYCSCSIDQLRKKINQDEFLNKLRNKKIGKDLKTAGDYCKERDGNWYEEL